MTEMIRRSILPLTSVSQFRPCFGVHDGPADILRNLLKQFFIDFNIDREISQDLIGQTLFAIDDETQHGYAIRKIEPVDTGCRVFTKCDHVGFEARSAKSWALPVTVFKTPD